MTLEELENRISELGKAIEKSQLEAIELNKQWWNIKQMQPKEKAYSWKECFQGKGFWASANGLIKSEMHGDFCAVPENTTIATTEKVIKSNDAACQLSHIIEAINKDFDGDEKLAFVFDIEDNELQWSGIYNWSLPALNSQSACNALKRTNKPLLLQYFGVEEK